MINLVKGQRVEIESGLTKMKVELRWKVNPNADPPYDLDASTLLGSSGQIDYEEDFVCYDLDEDFSTEKGVEFGRLYRRGNGSKFQAVGEGNTEGLMPILQKYASKFI